MLGSLLSKSLGLDPPKVGRRHSMKRMSSSLTSGKLNVLRGQLQPALQLMYAQANDYDSQIFVQRLAFVGLHVRFKFEEVALHLLGP